MEKIGRTYTMANEANDRMTPDQLRAHQGASTSEREHQEAVFEWCEAKSAEVPELSLIFAVPNGQMRQGMPMEPGMKSGVPDLCLPVPAGDHGPSRWQNLYHALFIELKRPDGRVREEQQEWIDVLREQGYKAEVCYGASEAIETLESYLGIGG